MPPLTIELAERRILPDPVIRLGIRRLCRQRLNRNGAALAAELAAFIESSKSGPVALVPTAANEQHYEVPPVFFEHALGPRRKYSCGYWPTGQETLAEAEEAMLSLTCQRARIEDGMRILDLGCGWGAMTLWLAEHFPHSRISGVSNSTQQREFILRQIEKRGFGDRVDITTADMNDYVPQDQFDRIVSVEMFEHMHNFEELLRRIATWLTPDGKLFVHTFCHRTHAYPFVVDDGTDWMARYFFTGGMMPNEMWLDYFNRDLRTEQRWWVPGGHYARTCNAWLERMTRHRRALLPVLSSTYGDAQAERWFQRWRMFFMACAELFALHDGNEWGVVHSLLQAAPR